MHGKKMFEPTYEHFRRHCWKKTRFLIIRDSVEDYKMFLKDLPDYQVPPPLEFLLATTVCPEPISATGTDDR